MKKLLVALAIVGSLSVPALASQCPGLMKKVDDAMATAQVNDADRAKIAELRSSGEALHNEGKHAESEAALNEALKLLGQ